MGQNQGWIFLNVKICLLISLRILDERVPVLLGRYICLSAAEACNMLVVVTVERVDCGRYCGIRFCCLEDKKFLLFYIIIMFVVICDEVYEKINWWLLLLFLMSTAWPSAAAERDGQTFLAGHDWCSSSSVRSILKTKESNKTSLEIKEFLSNGNKVMITVHFHIKKEIMIKCFHTFLITDDKSKIINHG